jgi:hypothetical protein
MTSEKVYITILGRSSWALLNSYYAVLRETNFHPTEILIFSEDLFQERVGAVKEGLTILSEAYVLSPRISEIILKEADFLEACTRIPEVIREKNRQGSSVALDITSGRKALIAGALVTVPREALEHVFYLAITSTKDAAKPYLMIPLQIQDLKDFRTVIGVCGEREQ